eukprot:CAMPEP_0116839396 /NCGR_PEP_ID=MMETSP0418-20121206/9746_1 /TAXON_ID=1158023 /ORGANISM="Astrosyne radiata, Strain 13vi08-1A" /LENGTH=673 /DNA_ID=CAMNT_0004469507 /DNA_START=92 /DNA_END=2113 /DNA_ORIENTATION=+
MGRMEGIGSRTAECQAGSGVGGAAGRLGVVTARDVAREELPAPHGCEREFLRHVVLEAPLCEENTNKLAVEMGELADRFVDQLMSGHFCHKSHRRRNHAASDEENIVSQEECSFPESGRCNSYKIKFEALRNFTFDLVDGPILRMNKWTCRGIHGCKDSKNPDRSTMLLWMERLKRAMCDIKLTFGTEWMYIWLLNEYGRAVNARMHLEKEILVHVEQRAQVVPIKRSRGHILHDPLAMPFPIITLAENVFHRSETVTGKPMEALTHSSSEPLDISSHWEFNRQPFHENPQVDEELQDEKSFGDQEPDDDEDVKKAPQLEDEETRKCSPKARCRRASSCPPDLCHVDADGQEESMPFGTNPRRQATSTLDRLLRQKDGSGTGLTNAVITELSIMLWMMLDVGNAWTAMALNLLALDELACIRVQQELDDLIQLHGRDQLFTPPVLSQFKTLDALLYEAIRLCPPFLGGMKILSKTIELPGVQIPKNTNVIFCQATEEAFDLDKSMGKRPQDLGNSYPCPELHGFLPFQGLEVPLMVLQSKVFVAVLLQRCTPFLSRKRTIIRRIKTALSVSRFSSSSEDRADEETGTTPACTPPPEPAMSLDHASSVDTIWEASKRLGGSTQTEAMKLFTKIPFPEPRRVLNVRERVCEPNTEGTSTGTPDNQDTHLPLIDNL